MNLYELNKILERVKNDKELFDYYTRKKNELLKNISIEIKKQLINL